MKQSDTIFTHLFELGRLMRRRMSTAAALSMPQIETLHFVEEHSSPTMSDLAEFLKVKAPTATAVVDELVTTKLLERTPGKDRRQISLALTPKGKKIFDQTLETRKQILGEVLAGLNDHDCAAFDHILKTIISTNK